MINKAFSLLKIILATLILTVVLIFVGAFFAYKLKCTDEQINLIVSIIYAATCFLAGHLLTAVLKEKRLICGICSGISYYLVVLIISLIVNGGLRYGISHLLTNMAICVAASTIGAILKK